MKNQQKMETTKTLFLLFLTTLITISCSKDNLVTESPLAENNMPGQNKHFDYTIGEGPFVHFEDVVFKEILLNNFNINTNKDNEISFDEASSYDGIINVFAKNITSVVGIEKFVNIIALDCSNNNIEKLDLSKNINLKFLECSGNPFSEIDLTRNIKLTHLNINGTNLTTLDLSENPNLIAIRGVCNFYLKTVNINNYNNEKILVFFFNFSNFNLECIQVDDVNKASSATNWLIPADAEYSLNCFDHNV